MHLPAFGHGTTKSAVAPTGRRAEIPADLPAGRYLVVVWVRVDQPSASGEAFYDINVAVE